LRGGFLFEGARARECVIEPTLEEVLSWSDVRRFRLASESSPLAAQVGGLPNCGTEENVLRYVGGVERATLDHDILQALAEVPDRLVVHSRELAAELGESVQAVAPRLGPLVRAGLVSKHWDTRHTRTRAYMITEHGRNYLARVADAAVTERRDTFLRTALDQLLARIS
jgi:DNA-binding MarR family transcriptional regulator